jgi:sulfur carrier protein ThiS
MQIQLQLMGALKSKSPAGNRIDVPEGATIESLLDSLDIEPKQVQIVMLNNRPQPDRSISLSPDDRLTVVPPVGGG